MSVSPQQEWQPKEVIVVLALVHSLLVAQHISHHNVSQYLLVVGGSEHIFKSIAYVPTQLTNAHLFLEIHGTEAPMHKTQSNSKYYRLLLISGNASKLECS